MWHLSSGTVVEEKMREVAMKIDHEHPSHSLILDVNDKCWLDVFKPSEREEIRRSRAVELPVLSVEMETYLQELAYLDADQFYIKVDSGIHEISSGSSWLQKSYRDAFRLLQSDFFPLQSQTEGNVVRRVWSGLDSCSDFSVIKCVSGEKCSKATADASNKDRFLSDVGRQSSGRKMDYLFTTRKTKFEVGCGECALVGGVKTTKELVDAGFKMPKVMRDMANSIFLKKIVLLVNDLTIVGFYIRADVMKMFTLDFPSGYVGRLNGIGPAYFPVVEENTNSLEHVLGLILLTGKMITENEQANTCWNDYSSSEEMKEIKSFQAKKLPLLPSDTKVYMDELKATPKSTLYEKMPKVMRDMMMFKNVADSPVLVHKLHIPGFYIADKMLTLWILDSPAGYVSRYDAFPSVQYPITESKIRTRMATLLARIMAARIIMEQCQDTIDDDDLEPSIDRYQYVMEPNFVPVGLTNKKRKQ
ncbi:hypothetical protein MAM1_0315d09576 [Mucor ambiguus]|uniref:Uncharacterized protein n=1 Tax=Mucor ambiguus TaxID=91626 RepID=A0A0C9N1Z5_9FUNG|nr:hypothetical protein MAM1_0315d09576 [Mucor ambiguus]